MRRNQSGSVSEREEGSVEERRREEEARREAKMKVVMTVGSVVDVLSLGGSRDDGWQRCCRLKPRSLSQCLVSGVSVSESRREAHRKEKKRERVSSSIGIRRQKPRPYIQMIEEPSNSN